MTALRTFGGRPPGQAAAAPPGGGPAGRSAAGAAWLIFRTRPQVPHVSMNAARPVPHFGQRTARSRPSDAHG